METTDGEAGAILSRDGEQVSWLHAGAIRRPVGARRDNDLVAATATTAHDYDLAATTAAGTSTVKPARDGDLQGLPTPWQKRFPHRQLPGGDRVTFLNL